jgi:large subunit ribosomal protein L4
MIITADTDKNIVVSARNIPKVMVCEAVKPNTYDIMNADVIVIQKSAIPVLENTIEPKVEEEAA